MEPTTSGEPELPLSRKRSLLASTGYSYLKHQKISEKGLDLLGHLIPGFKDSTPLVAADSPFFPDKDLEPELFPALLEFLPANAKALIKKNATLVPSRWVPAAMDAREIILAALHFLCHIPYDDAPLLSLDNEQDLEKAVFSAKGSWTISEVLPTLAKWETLFWKDASAWPARCVAVPRSIYVTEALLLKGTAPPALLGKKKPRPKTKAADKQE